MSIRTLLCGRSGKLKSEYVSFSDGLPVHFPLQVHSSFRSDKSAALSISSLAIFFVGRGLLYQWQNYASEIVTLLGKECHTQLCQGLSRCVLLSWPRSSRLRRIRMFISVFTKYSRLHFTPSHPLPVRFIFNIILQFSSRALKLLLSCQVPAFS